jgi:hypothetical protein
MYGNSHIVPLYVAGRSPAHGNNDLETDQKAYIDRFCEVMEPPVSNVHQNDTSDEFERQIGEIEEIEHKIDLENL